MIVLMTGVIGFNTPLNPLSRGERDTPCLYKLALSGKSGLPDLAGHHCLCWQVCPAGYSLSGRSLPPPPLPAWTLAVTERGSFSNDLLLQNCVVIVSS